MLHSEPFGIPFRTPATWKPVVKSMAGYTGCNLTNVQAQDACLRAASVASLLSAQVSAGRLPTTTPAYGPAHSWRLS